MPDETGGTGSGGGTDLERGVGALEKFQERVDKLLADLESSAASRTKVAAQTVPRSSFSGPNAPFAEADGLYAQYNRVHESLVSLSATLRDQIEYLRIAVYGSAVGYDNVEDELRRRFHEIRADLVEDASRAKESEHRTNDDKSASYGRDEKR
ncbi:hypothetical protein GUY61_30040 [Streptomyces sp. GC420]|nr:hypothetical protein [Streptomyces sp. GC420]